MFGFLFSWFIGQLGPKISCTKTQTLPDSRIPDTSADNPRIVLIPTLQLSNLRVGAFAATRVKVGLEKTFSVRGENRRKVRGVKDPHLVDLGIIWNILVCPFFYRVAVTMAGYSNLRLQCHISDGFKLLQNLNWWELSLQIWAGGS